MRPIHYYIGILSFMGYVYCLPLAGQVKRMVAREVNPRLEYTEVKTERSEDGEALTVSFNVSSMIQLNSQEIIYVYPSLVSADGSTKIALSPLCISGKKRYKAVMRKKTLSGNSDTLPFIEGIRKSQSLKKSKISVRETVPFERWMATGHVSLREEIYGCTECAKNVNQSDVSVEKINLFGPGDYRYDFYIPEKIEVKCYEEEFNCKVTFKSAQHELLLAFGDNRNELSRLDDFISNGLKIKGAKLREVHIAGYASPEGEFIYNKRLAELRTNTLSYHVLSKYPQLKKALIYQTKGVGEDWEGLEDIIKTSSMEYKNEILSAIDENDTDVAREAVIRSLDGGKVYTELLASVYPVLRRTTFRMKFDVRPYTDDELDEVFAAIPGCLSQYEMYRLAQKYIERGENPVKIYRKAYEQFAPDPLAILNYANALLKFESDANGALKVLKEVCNDSRALLPIAIAYDMKGEWRHAEEVLKEAISKGIRLKQ